MSIKIFLIPTHRLGRLDYMDIMFSHMWTG